METVMVKLANGRSYPVCIGKNVLSQSSSFIRRRVVIVTHSRIQRYYADGLMETLRTAGKEVIITLVGEGERYKSLDSISMLLDCFVNSQLQRNDCVLALGGGVIGDLAGFAAAIYMRGIDVIQAPTTLLAQVDAAIGGKTGVNHTYGKNLIGAFHQPCAVLADTEVLQTLETKEYCSGLAEVVKYGLLGDADFFTWIEQQQESIMKRDSDVIENIVYKSVLSKAQIVFEDERETTGKRALLNLGHTIGHALEAEGKYERWSHGEAVALGIVAIARLCEQVNGFEKSSTKRIINLLNAFQLPVTLPADINIKNVLDKMCMDKKNTVEGKRFVLMKEIGDAYLADKIDENLIIKSLESLIK